MWILYTIILALIAYILFKGSRKGSQRGGRIEFFSKGMDSGFSVGDINLLWKAVQNANLPNPLSIFGSVNELEKSISHIAEPLTILGLEDNDPQKILLEKLFEYRKKIESGHPRFHTGLKSTRSMKVGQEIFIRVSEIDIMKSMLIENNPESLVISLPVGSPIPPGFTWQNKILNIHFRHKGDAAYFFQTRLINNVSYVRMGMSLALHHSEEVLRSQRRKILRADIDMDAEVELSQDDANDEKFKKFCKIKNLSVNGLAFEIPGKVKANRPFRVFLTVRGEHIILLCKPIRDEYDEEKNKSNHFVSFIRPSDRIKLLLQFKIFGLDNKVSTDFDEKSDAETLEEEFFEDFEGAEDLEEAEDLMPAEAEDLEEAEDLMPAEAEDFEEIEDSEEAEDLMPAEAEDFEEIEDSEEAEDLIPAEVEDFEEIEDSEEAEDLMPAEAEDLEEIEDSEEAEDLMPAEAEDLEEIEELEEVEELEEIPPA